MLGGHHGVFVKVLGELHQQEAPILDFSVSHKIALLDFTVDSGTTNIQWSSACDIRVGCVGPSTANKISLNSQTRERPGRRNQTCYRS